MPRDGDLVDDLAAAGLPRQASPRVLTLRAAFGLAFARDVRSEDGAEPAPASLEPETLERRLKESGAGDFEAFRARYVARGAEQARFEELVPEFLGLLARFEAIQEAAAARAEAEMLLEQFTRLAEGEPANVSQLLVDRIDRRIQEARGEYVRRRDAYRDALDALKVRLGLPADAEVIPDHFPMAAFRDQFVAIHRWLGEADHEFEALVGIIDRLPKPDEMFLGGLPVFATPEDRLEPLLRAAADQDADPETRAGQGDRLRIRTRVRALRRAHGSYETAKRNLILAVREASNRYQQILAPPASAKAGPIGETALELVEARTAIRREQTRLVDAWAELQAHRAALPHDLGRVLDPDWESFLARFVARPGEPEEAARPAPPPAAPPSDRPPGGR